MTVSRCFPIFTLGMQELDASGASDKYVRAHREWGGCTLASARAAQDLYPSSRALVIKDTFLEIIFYFEFHFPRLFSILRKKKKRLGGLSTFFFKSPAEIKMGKSFMTVQPLWLWMLQTLLVRKLCWTLQVLLCSLGCCFLPRMCLPQSPQHTGDLMCSARLPAWNHRLVITSAQQAVLAPSAPSSSPARIPNLLSCLLAQVWFSIVFVIPSFLDSLAEKQQTQHCTWWDPTL